MKGVVYRYGSICEPDIIEGFRELGIEVYEIDIEVKDKSILPNQTVKMVSDFLQNTPVDFVFSVNFYPAISEVCNIYHIRYFSWTVDSPVLEIFTKAISNEWNRTFLFDRKQYDDIYQYNPGRIFHLPLAANPVAMENRIKENSAGRAVFSHDIAFVGSLYSEKCPFVQIKGLSDFTKGYLDGIIDAQKKVYGYYFVDEILSDNVIAEMKSKANGFKFLDGYENYITDKIIASQYYIASKITANERHDLFSGISEAVGLDIYTASDTSKIMNINNHGTCKTITEMPVIFNSSKININPTSKGIRSGVPLRVFDILSCGGFVISNYQEELGELFSIGEDLAVYSSIEECVDLCRYYLEHENERKDIAMAGYEKLCKYHTYKLRLAQMITTGYEL